MYNVKRTLGQKLSALIVAGMLLLMAALFFFTWHFMRKTFVDFYAIRAQKISAMVADIVDGDRVMDYALTGQTDEYYEQLELIFSKLKEDCELDFLYMFYPREDSFVYLLEGRADGDSGELFNNLGDVYEYREEDYAHLLPDVKAKKASKGVIFGPDVGYGSPVCAWAPVIDSRGELAAMVEADFLLTDVDEHMRTYSFFILASMLAAVFLLSVVFLAFTRKMVSEPMKALGTIVDSYHDGNFTLPEKGISTGDEIEALYHTLLTMVGRIEQYVENIKTITAEKERIGAELSIATQIQADMLPCIFPAFPDREEIDIYATMTPAREVGGDFYDFFWVDSRRLAMVIADVSGKGVPAALFMVIGKTLIKDRTRPGLALGEVFMEVNRLLCESNREGLFITAFECVLDLVTGELRYVNAGHEKPYLMRGGKGYERYPVKPGFVLAGFEDMTYEEGKTVLAPGDKIFLHTDGVTEAADAGEELYGDIRLKAVLDRNREKTPEELLAAVKEDIDQFAKGAPQFDDITMLALEYRKRMG